MMLTSQLNESYSASGVYSPIRIFNEQELSVYKKTIYEHLALLGNDIEMNCLGHLHLHFPWAHELSNHPRILELVKAILGENVLIHGSTLFSKMPGDGKYVSWHQDGYLRDFTSDEYVTAWLSIEKSTPENGCLRVIPGTHKKVYKHELIPADDNMLAAGLTAVGDFSEEDAIDIVLEPGEMSLHHVNLIHGSSPNLSDIPRIGYAIRYITPAVEQRVYHHEVMVASGSYTGSHYKVQHEVPTGDLEACIESQKLGMADYISKRNL